MKNVSFLLAVLSAVFGFGLSEAVETLSHAAYVDDAIKATAVVCCVIVALTLSLILSFIEGKRM